MFNIFNPFQNKTASTDTVITTTPLTQSVLSVVNYPIAIASSILVAPVAKMASTVVTPAVKIAEPIIKLDSTLQKVVLKTAGDVVFDGVIETAGKVVGCVQNAIVPGSGTAATNAGSTLRENLGTVAKGAHAIAEGVVATAGAQPVLGLIDKSVVHPALWEPLGALTSSDVANHPTQLENATTPLSQALVGPSTIIEGVGTTLTGSLGIVGGAVSLVGLQPVLKSTLPTLEQLLEPSTPCNTATCQQTTNPTAAVGSYDFLSAIATSTHLIIM